MRREDAEREQERAGRPDIFLPESKVTSSGSLQPALLPLPFLSHLLPTPLCSPPPFPISPLPLLKLSWPPRTGATMPHPQLMCFWQPHLALDTVVMAVGKGPRPLFTSVWVGVGGMDHTLTMGPVSVSFVALTSDPPTAPAALCSVSTD